MLANNFKQKRNIFTIQFLLSSGQNRQKNSLKERVFVNSAFKIQCHVVKSILVSCRLLFRWFCPLGIQYFLYLDLLFYFTFLSRWAKSPKKTVWRRAFLDNIWHCIL